MPRENDDLIDEIRRRLEMAIVGLPEDERKRLSVVNDDLCGRLIDNLNEAERIRFLNNGVGKP